MSNHAPADPDQLRAGIARTRTELGQTVQALAAKADVKTRLKARARRRAADLTGWARTRLAAATTTATHALHAVPSRAQAASRRIGAAAGPVRSRVDTLRRQATATAAHPQVRQAAPVAAAVAALTIAGVIVLRRSRA